MKEITERVKWEFEQIIKECKIRSVYQPIVSFMDGSILGYEALSRIELEECSFNVEEMFQIAKELDKIWELEELCRKKSLKYAKDKFSDTKIFLNVDPNIIHDKQFKTGMTIEYLKQYQLKPEDIIFEITERSAIEDIETFTEAVNHYKNQTFMMAIDDFGAGYSGLNRVCALSPDYIKFDRIVVHNIHMDSKKKSLVEGCLQFCKAEGIKAIAEGIESKEELEILIALGFDYGQGYYLQVPIAEKYDIQADKKSQIKEFYQQNRIYRYKPSFFGNVGTICKQKDTAYLKDSAVKIFGKIEKDNYASEIFVLNGQRQVKGILTRNNILKRFGGRFGYTLNERKTVEDLMVRNFLVADEETSIETVSKMALARPMDCIYDAVVVTNNGKYKGVVTVKDLLETAITLQVTRANDSSPLTGLPGNSIIQREIEHTIKQEEKYAVVYFDLDNFKAYNDAYGFHNGDLMLKTLARILKNTCFPNMFVGHIGGDDFVMIAKTWAIEDICHLVMERFEKSISNLYSPTDWEKGFIISQNRNGFQEKFPTATISAAIITNKKKMVHSMEELSKELAIVKKEAKQKMGNSVVIR